MNSVDPPKRGLAAVEEGRERRQRFPKIPGRFWLWVFTILAGWAIVYWKITQGQLESWRNRLLSEQRAVASELAPRFTPLRDKIEAWTVQAAGSYSGDFISPEAIRSDFRSQPGIYLRLVLNDAQTVQGMRSAAEDSLRDGFTSCFTTHKNPDPFAGTACKSNSECKGGEHCNETNHCTVPAQPYNLRVAYRATRILYDDWARAVREASSDMRLRLLDRDLQSAVRDDIPLVIDLMTRAKYFMLVLDEKPPQDVQVPDAGTFAESLQAVVHAARVFVWRLEDDKLLLRVRTTASADAATVAKAPAAQLAIRRQSNNCAIALDVRRRLESTEP
ncbi:MAG: hypothetical protein MUF54_03150 [Polyangiaceae bacterium]|jgi:hypothetical protein|nr:hypothetical protein [Polyangiaceae bacterium]